MNSALTRRHHLISILPLRFALKERNVEDVERHLHDISRPESAKRWSPEDVVRTIVPSDGTVVNVLAWLIASGIGKEGVALGRSRGSTVKEAEQPINTVQRVHARVWRKSRGWSACEVSHLRKVPCKN